MQSDDNFVITSKAMHKLFGCETVVVALHLKPRWAVWVLRQAMMRGQMVIC